MRVTTYTPNAVRVTTYSPEACRLIKASIARAFDVDVSDLFSPKRQRHLVVLRICIAYLFTRRYGMTHSDAARFLERDHTTVLSGLQSWGGLFLTPDGSEMVDRVHSAVDDAIAEMQALHTGRSLD